MGEQGAVGDVMIEMIVVIVIVGALVMLGIALNSQMYSQSKTYISGLDANSQEYANTAIQGSFNLFGTTIPVYAIVIFAVLIGIAIAAIVGAVRGATSGGGRSGGLPM